MIHIYKPSNTDYEHNGDITLLPSAATTHAILNGAWTAELTHPIDSEGRWKYITEEAVAKMPSFNGDQLYRIKQVSKQDSGVTATLEPIFYDSMNDCFLDDVRPTGKSGQEALEIMLAPNNKYSGQSNISKASTAYYQYVNFMEALNGDIDQSFINRWGGEILYDDFAVIVNERVGGDYGVELRYGKNIPKDGMTYDVDIRDVVTRIYPKAYNGRMMTGNGYVDSDLIDSYPMIKAVTMTFDNVKLAEDVQGDPEDTDIVCETQSDLNVALIQQCNSQFAAGIDKPTVTISVDMVLLENTEQYKDVQMLESVSLGDTIHCVNNHLGITTDARVIELEYDSIRKKVSSVVIGEAEYQYFNDITSSINRIDSVVRPNGTLMADKVQGILNGIYTQLNLQSTAAQPVDGVAFRVEQTDEDAPLYGCMVWGTQGIQIANKRTADGKDWDWETAITADGIVANAIITGILSDKTGTNYWNLDTGEFSLSAKSFYVDDETVQDYVDGAIDGKISEILSLTLQLTNDFCGIATDANGSGGDYSDCYTDVMLFIGSQDITDDASVQYTISPSAGITGNWDSNNKRYSVSYMSTDDGSVTITAKYMNLQVAKTFSIAKNKQGVAGQNGQNGQNGQDGRVFMLQVSSPVITQGADNSFSPQSITFSAYYRDGQSATRTAYSGRFVISETTDGVSYTTRYTSSQNESSHTYSPYSENVKNIRCILYASGGTTNALDQQGVAIVKDVSNLTQEDVFNILTNNGAIQGLYMKNGQVYINASYIASGILRVGGYNNQDGEIEVYDSSGELIGKWDREGFFTNGMYFAVTEDSRVYSNDPVFAGRLYMCGSLNGTLVDYAERTKATIINLAFQTSSGEPAGTYTVQIARNPISASGWLVKNVDLCSTDVDSLDIGADEVNVSGTLSVKGEKNRVVRTKNYSDRKLSSYEMASPMFGDIGEGETDGNGECVISISDVFGETVNADVEYQVFLQKEGDGEIWVDSKKHDYFVVKGTPKLKFAWEIKAKQRDYEYNRLELHQDHKTPVSAERYLETYIFEEMEEQLL